MVVPRMLRIATSGIGELVGDGIGVAAESRSGIELETGFGWAGDVHPELNNKITVRETKRANRCTEPSDVARNAIASRRRQYPDDTIPLWWVRPKPVRIIAGSTIRRGLLVPLWGTRVDQRPTLQSLLLW
jgi:hypothetical protein